MQLTYRCHHPITNQKKIICNNISELDTYTIQYTQSLFDILYDSYKHHTYIFYNDMNVYATD